MIRRSLHPGAILLASLLLSPALPAAAQDWSGRGRAHGTVKDEQGRPVAGAKITLHESGRPEAGPEPFFTDKKGRWVYLGLRGGDWAVLIDADGFLPSEGTYYVNEFDTPPPAVIVLARNPTASIDKGDVQMDAGDFAAARAEYLKALEGLDAIGQARLRSRIGDTYYQEGNFAAARAEYVQALVALAPEEQAHVRIQLGNSYQQEGDYASARAEFEKALPLLAPAGQAQILLAMAKGYDLAGDRAAAIATLERGLELAPGEEMLLSVIADLLTREGREDEAQQYLAQLPEDAAVPTDTLLNIGIRHYNEKRLPEALDFFNRAAKEDPDNPTVYYYRGLTYLALEKNSEAAEDFKKLLAIDPDGENSGEAREFLAFLEE